MWLFNNTFLQLQVGRSSRHPGHLKVYSWVANASCIEFSCLAKVLEGFIHRRLLKQQVNCDIDPRKYAREGQQHKHWSIYSMQYTRQFWHRKLLCSHIFADFSKGFHIIDHNILLQELCFLNVDQTLYPWIRASLTNRTQAVRVGNSLSPWRHTYGGVPQGTKLGITLFAIMINSTWWLALKIEVYWWHDRFWSSTT